MTVLKSKLYLKSIYLTKLLTVLICTVKSYLFILVQASKVNLKIKINDRNQIWNLEPECRGLSESVNEAIGRHF